MTLETHQLDFPVEFIESARDELFRYEQERSEQKCIWGYFPGLEKDERELYPHCIRLAEALRAYFIKRGDWTDQEPTLSFIKLASSKPVMQFGGLHVDDKVNATDIPASHSQKKILRTIINLGDYPRKLMHTKLSADELRSRASDIISLYHDGHRGKVDLELGLERFVLGM